MVDVTTMLTELTVDPQAFLRHYHVLIAGSASNRSGVATFNVAQNVHPYTGFTTGISGLRGLTKTRQSLLFTFASLPALKTPGPDQFNAHYVAMTQTADGPATTHTMVSGTDGPDIMLTSQLSSCSFGIGSATADGSRLMSHIQPAKKGSDRDFEGLHDTLEQGFGDAGHTLFERANQQGNTNYGHIVNRATIIGVRRNGRWKLYAQIYEPGTARTLHKVQTLN